MSDGEIEALIPNLRRYARALTGQAAEADDLVQDCLERALPRLWRRPDNLRAWLFAILRNLWIDELRRRGARPTMVALDGSEDRLGVDGGQGHSLEVRDLRAALTHLAPEQREVVLLVGLEGMSYAQAAEVTGVPVGTVMSRLKRGRDRLSQLMHDGPPSLRRVK